MYHDHNPYSSPYNQNQPRYNSNLSNQYSRPYMKDFGPKPFVVNINEATVQNNNFRTTIWTGCHMQLTLMSIKVGEDIGLEIHPDVDQFLRIEQGQGVIMMGNRRDRFDFQEKFCQE